MLESWDEYADLIVHDSVEIFDEWMMKMDMVLEVQQSIKQALIAWKKHREYFPHDSDRQGFVEALYTPFSKE